jgi:hypothetical protein
VVLATHITFSAYGFWLPNDPRGSWSDFVASWELFRFGKATKTNVRYSIADAPHDRELRRAAKTALEYPPVRFDEAQMLSVAKGFAQAVADAAYVVRACAIMHDHAHLVILRHEPLAEKIVGHLKAAATRQLILDGLHPLAACRTSDGRVPTPWVEGCWKVYLDSPADIRSAIRYDQENPVKEGRPRQTWSFVSAYTG